MKMSFNNVIASLEMLRDEEESLPKSFKTKISVIISILNIEKEDEDIRKHKAEALLDEISEESSLPSFVRTQIYQIVSLLQDY